MQNKERKLQYKVSCNITSEDRGSMVYEGKVEFCHKPHDYGNGYQMGIRSEQEPFGLQGYDIRYDDDFKGDFMEYLYKFFKRRFSGENGKWRMTSISIEEVELAKEEFEA